MDALTDIFLLFRSTLEYSEFLVNGGLSLAGLHQTYADGIGGHSSGLCNAATGR